MRGGYFFSQQNFAERNLEKSQTDTVATTETWLDHRDTDWEGSGTEDDPFLISSAEELAGLSYMVSVFTNYNSKWFKQTANIDLRGYTWIPIGYSRWDSGKPFDGHYDGDNYEIRNMYVYNKDTAGYGGLFGQNYCSILRNINLKNIYVENRNTAQRTGGLLGMVEGDTTVTNCHVQGVVIGGYKVGGIAGETTGITMRDCSFIGSVQGAERVGGIIGCVWETSGYDIADCQFIGHVKASTSGAGGIIGYSENMDTLTCIMRRCYSDGIIESLSLVGSFAGVLISATVQDCVGKGQLNIIDKGISSYIAGFVGSCTNLTLNNNCYIGNSNNRGITFISSSATGCTIESCYMSAGLNGLYSNGDFSGWSIIAGMNDDLPMQKALYHVAQFGEGVDANWFIEKGYSKV